MKAIDINCGSRGNFRLTEHALERYFQRAKADPRKAQRALNKIISHFSSAVQLDKKHWYGGVWVYVVLNRAIVTIFKPNMHSGFMKKIYKAFNANPTHQRTDL